MKKSIRLMVLLLAVSTLFAGQSLAQGEPPVVTIRQLNSYANTPTRLADIAAHPLVNQTVRIRAVVSGFPQNSGLSSGLTLVHLFVVDTLAYSEGIEGHSLRMVAAPAIVGGLRFGDVFEATGALTFFGSRESQFSPTAVEVLGNTEDDEDLAKYKTITTAREITDLSILNTPVPGGRVALNYANYTSYNNAYVTIKNAVVVNVGAGPGAAGGRFNWGLQVGESIIYINDISLRFRNDQSTNAAYINAGYNYRRLDVDGAFAPPPVGTVVNVSGYLFINNFNNDAHYDETNGQAIFKINPWDDGILWVKNQDNTETRFVSGQPNPFDPDTIFEWKNDLEIIGFPVTVTDVEYSNAVPVADEPRSVTVTMNPGGDEDQITRIDLYWGTNPSNVQKVEITPANEFTFEFPGQAAGTTVIWRLELENTSGIVSNAPGRGFYNYSVPIETITSIELLQRTPGDLRGPSLFAGEKDLAMDFDAVVVSDETDGVIVIQSGKGPWSGIFLRNQENTSALRKGDKINVTEADVLEATIASFSGHTYTYLENVSFTKIGEVNDYYDEVVPTLTVQELMSEIEPGEAWEGMLVRIANPVATRDAGFGEFEISTMNENNEYPEVTNFRMRNITGASSIGETQIAPFSYLNRTVRLNRPFSHIDGIITYNFNVTKIVPRNLADLGAEGNWSRARRDVLLSSPANNATVNLAPGNDVVIEWAESSDPDGDDVTYAWQLLNNTRTEVLATIPSDNDGQLNRLTMNFRTVDSLLVINGVQPGASAALSWTVLISDGSDTLRSMFLANGSYSTERFNNVTLARNATTSIDEEDHNPRVFALNQNYPNPFNPSTTITYSLAENVKVNIEVYNILGERVATLVNNQTMPAGQHTVNFDASRLASGMYIYRIRAGNFVSSKKMMLVK